jgi:hypothetical protein
MGGIENPTPLPGRQHTSGVENGQKFCDFALTIGDRKMKSSCEHGTPSRWPYTVAGTLREGVVAVGVSDPELRKKLFGPKLVQFDHEQEKRSWPRWKRLMHRLRPCPICKPKKNEGQSRAS